ncbi:MAG: hypothetical protein WA936_01310 [Erythrobacter sp.]|uniref:hypothetical protein n=1 Tax=Erythrobacter sp. TaxID=1042 RepID=UPI003C747FAE
MARLFKFFSFAVIAGLAGAGVTLIFHVGVASPPGAGADITYADFLAITLTALALMITVLGLFVAAAGVIGWSTIESKLRDHSVNYFKDQLGKDGDLRAEMEKLIVNIAHNGIDSYKAREAIPNRKEQETEDADYDD